MATKNKVYHQLPHRLWMKVSLAILVLYLSNMGKSLDHPLNYGGGST
jgi:hypothetical protein